MFLRFLILSFFNNFPNFWYFVSKSHKFTLNTKNIAEINNICEHILSEGLKDQACMDFVDWLATMCASSNCKYKSKFSSKEAAKSTNPGGPAETAQLSTTNALQILFCGNIACNIIIGVASQWVKIYLFIFLP